MGASNYICLFSTIFNAVTAIKNLLIEPAENIRIYLDKLFKITRPPANFTV
jgi:hypothetical protein